MTYTIATIASHSCLQILHGAKAEGFLTLALAKPSAVEFYQQFPFIDRVLSPEDFAQEGTEHVVLIPHGSFVAYGMLENQKSKVKSLKSNEAKLFGNKKILEIEADRQVQHQWMQEAKVNVPKIFATPEEVDRPVIIKYFGARGGQGYTVAANKREVIDRLSRHSGLSGISAEKSLHSDPGPNSAKATTGRQSRMTSEKYIIQEYIIGTPVYCQYFYSVVRDRLEIMGFDRRYETDVDGIGRVPAVLQQKIDVNPTFTVIGNLPLVVRESLLPEFYDMGKRVIAAAKKMTESNSASAESDSAGAPQGLWGPFCLETIITPDQKITVIEISERIVAGTNLYIKGSPYSDLLFDEPMSTGRRIAREIKEAIGKGLMDEIIS